jgi:hypothetical protein
MRDGVKPKVQLAPPSARSNAVFLIEPFSPAVSLEAGAFDKKMQGLRAIDALRQDRQATTATQGRMIGDDDIDPEHIADRPSVWRRSWWNTRRSARPVSTAIAE